MCILNMNNPNSVLYRFLQLLAFTSYSHVFFLSVLIYIFVDSVVSALFQCVIRRSKKFSNSHYVQLCSVKLLCCLSWLNCHATVDFCFLGRNESSICSFWNFSSPCFQVTFSDMNHLCNVVCRFHRISPYPSIRM